MEKSKQDGSIPLIDNRGVGPALTCPGPCPAPLPPCHPMGSASQLSQFHKAESSFVQYSISVSRYKRKATTPTLSEQDNGGPARQLVQGSKAGRDVPRLSK